MSNKWQVIEYSNSCLRGIKDLFQVVFKKNSDEEYFRWQIINNPFGNSIIKLADSENRIVGHVGYYLLYLKIFNNDILCGQFMNTMVHPDFRRMGISEKLTEECIREGAEKGVQFVFRFPNKIALSAALKLNMVKLYNIPQYVKILKGDEVLSLFTGSRVLCSFVGLCFGLLRRLGKNFNIKYNDYETRDIQKFNKDFDDLWQKEKFNYNIAVNRTSEYLNWRYVISPNKYKRIGIYKNNTLMGYIVMTIRNKAAKNGLNVKIGYIVDLLCARQDYLAIRILLSEAEKYLCSEGTCAISCWMLKNVFYSKHLTQARYFHFKSPVVLAGLVISNKLGSLKDKLYDSKNWFLTSGDSDYI